MLLMSGAMLSGMCAIDNMHSRDSIELNAYCVTTGDTTQDLTLQPQFPGTWEPWTTIRYV